MQEQTQHTETTPTTTDKRVVKRKISCVDNDVLEKAFNELDTPSDEFHTFGEFVGSEVRNLKFDHNRRKLKRIIQKAILDISEIDENERSSSATTLSHTSVYYDDSMYSASPAIEPTQSPQAHSSSSCNNVNSSGYETYHDLGKYKN